MITLLPIILTLALLVVIVAIAIFYDEDCPRVIRGYNCKGGDVCDHSPEAVRQAKIDMDKTYWGGRNETRF